MAAHATALPHRHGVGGRIICGALKTSPPPPPPPPRDGAVTDASTQRTAAPEPYRPLTAHTQQHYPAMATTFYHHPATHNHNTTLKTLARFKISNFSFVTSAHATGRQRGTHRERERRGGGGSFLRRALYIRIYGAQQQVGNRDTLKVDHGDLRMFARLRDVRKCEDDIFATH